MRSLSPPESQGKFTVLARDLCGAHFSNTLVTSRAPAIRLGGRTLINASSDPLAHLPTPSLFFHGCRQRTHAVSSMPSRRSWARQLCTKAGSSRNGGRKCKVRRRYYRSAFISTRLATPNWLGFARRYFTLYESGVLSYAFGPGEPVRDQISLGQAAISNEPCRYDPSSSTD